MNTDNITQTISNLTSFIGSFVGGNVYLTWLIFCILSALLLLLFGTVFRKLLASRLRRLSKTTDGKLDDMLVDAISGLNWFFDITLGVLLATYFLQPEHITRIVNVVSILIVSVYLVNFVAKILNYLLQILLRKGIAHGKEINPAISNFLELTINVVIWLMVGLTLLDSVGFQITALVGGIGLIGLAVSFALQNVLEDLLSFFTIYFDKPFEVDEFVTFSGKAGTVKSIGVRSTKIKTLAGETLVVPNNQISSEYVHNFGRMETRRVEFGIGVEYNTDPEKLKQIPEWVEKIVKNIESVEFSRAHLNKFGDFSLIYEIVYVVQTDEYSVYMDVQQQIMHGIIDKFNQHNISMAFPTQTINLRQDTGVLSSDQ